MAGEQAGCVLQLALPNDAVNRAPALKWALEARSGDAVFAHVLTDTARDQLVFAGNLVGGWMLQVYTCIHAILLFCD